MQEGNCHGTVTRVPKFWSGEPKRVQWVLLMTMTGEAQITNCSLENVTNVLDHPGQHTIGNLASPNAAPPLCTAAAAAAATGLV